MSASVLTAPASPQRHGSVLALLELQGEFGASAHILEENSVMVFGRLDSLGNERARTLRLLLEQVQPSVIILNASAHETFPFEVEEAIKDCRIDVNEIKRQPARTFEIGMAMRLLNDLGFTKAYLQACINGGNVAAMTTVGALLFFAEKNQLLPRGMLTKLELINLDNFMYVDLASLHSLDIMREEEHPSVIRTYKKSKEGFSLITLLDRTKSVMGRKVLRRWVRQPLANVIDLEERYDVIEFLMKPQAQEKHADLQAFLQDLRDMNRILSKFRNRTAKTGEWLAFAQSVSAMDAVLDFLSVLEKEMVKKHPDLEVPDLFSNIMGFDRGSLDHVLRLLEKIDWETTKENDWVCPLPGVSHALDEARRRHKNVPALLVSVRNRLQETYPTHRLASFMEPRFIPLLGFLVRIPREAYSEVNTLLPADFDRLFTKTVSDDEHEEETELAYFRCDMTRELDEKLGDLHGKVQDLELQICKEFEDHIVEMEGDLARIANACAELDVLISFAGVSLDFEFVRPTITNGTLTKVEQGCHPLLFLSVDNYVPCDFVLGEDETKVMVISGPNYSGKSVALKTFAMLTIMAQIGCWVPAKKAEFGIVDRLFTRVESLETSIALMESSFSIDVQQVAYAMRNCTAKSLIIMDEFGKGTNTLDGASLLVATIKAFCRNPSITPRIMITTHFLEILEGPLLQDCKGLKLAEMQVLLNAFQNEAEAERNQDIPQETMQMPVPLFQLVMGAMCSRSYALACAQRANVPGEVLQRSSTVITLFSHGMQPSEDVEQDQRQAELLRKIASRDWAKAERREIEELLELLKKT